MPIIQTHERNNYIAAAANPLLSGPQNPQYSCEGWLVVHGMVVATLSEERVRQRSTELFQSKPTDIYIGNLTSLQRTIN